MYVAQRREDASTPLLWRAVKPNRARHAGVGAGSPGRGGTALVIGLFLAGRERPHHPAVGAVYLMRRGACQSGIHGESGKRVARPLDLNAKGKHMGRRDIARQHGADTPSNTRLG